MARTQIGKSPNPTRLTPAMAGGAFAEAGLAVCVQGGEVLTASVGVPVDDADNSLQMGEGGPTLTDGGHLCEKITHFDRKRIPE